MEKLNATKKNIGTLFTELNKNKFIIPEYQRKYDWDIEKCETLWDDMTGFFGENVTNDEEYFLGTLVLCKAENSNDLEIIDGQQRITSFLLLLRAFYSKLEKMTPDDNIRGLTGQIEPCIWETNKISKQVDDKTKIHLLSNANIDPDNELLYNILEKGTHTEEKNTPHSHKKYQKNYNFFYEQCNTYAQNNPIQWQALIVFIIERCIVLPIECPNTETALTIFSTLNDRGLPLSDSDIFKANMYKSLAKKDKESFIKKWKELDENTQAIGLRFNDLFRYYSHIIRAKDKNSKKEIGLRKFYSFNNHERLKNKKLIDDLSGLCNFWTQIIKFDSENYNDFLNKKARCYIHCLFQYPNEFWRYVISVFYFRNKDLFDKSAFETFLKRTVAFLFYKFLENPSIAYIKDPIYRYCISLYHNKGPDYTPSLPVEEETIKHTSPRMKKGILLLHTYLDRRQNKPIPRDFEIEHIFPKKWQTANYNGWNKSDAEKYLDKLGNLVPIEKKVNIQAGNSYFEEKKKRYKKSKIRQVIKLSKYAKHDWLKEDIEERDKAVTQELLSFFKTCLAQS